MQRLQIIVLLQDELRQAKIDGDATYIQDLEVEIARLSGRGQPGAKTSKRLIDKLKTKGKI